MIGGPRPSRVACLHARSSNMCLHMCCRAGRAQSSPNRRGAAVAGNSLEAARCVEDDDDSRELGSLITDAAVLFPSRSERAGEVGMLAGIYV